MGTGSNYLSTFINIRTDYGFKRIFGNPKNKHLLIRFFNALFDNEIHINDVDQECPVLHVA